MDQILRQWPFGNDVNASGSSQLQAEHRGGDAEPLLYVLGVGLVTIAQIAEGTISQLPLDATARTVAHEGNVSDSVFRPRPFQRSVLPGMALMRAAVITARCGDRKLGGVDQCRCAADLAGSWVVPARQ